MSQQTTKRLALKTLACCAAVASLLGTAGLAQAQTKLKWAHVYETSEAYHTSSVWAAEEIKKRTAGRYDIQVFPASTLGKESDINQGLQLGTVDIIISGASFAARSFPRIGVAYYPYTFRDSDHLLKYAKSDVFKELSDGYKAKTGIQTVAVTYYGARHSTSNKAFKNCDEMKGLKMRVPDVPAYMALPRACGANPTPIAFAEVYLALQNGTVDALISGASFAARSFPRIGVAYYPYTFRDSDHLLKYAKSDVFKELSDGYKAKTGIQTVAVTYYGARHSTSNKAFKNCDEMKGLKMRVPDVPAYMALPRACGANPTPIAFAEVYLALQNGTVDAQENPLPTIEAKKFYEVQKNIIMTGHILDSLVTQVGPHVWNKLSDADKKIFTDVMQEAAAKGTAEIKKREGELVSEFKKKGINMIDVNKDDFRARIVKAVDMASMGYDKKDWDRIQAIK